MRFHINEDKEMKEKYRIGFFLLIPISVMLCHLFYFFYFIVYVFHGLVIPVSDDLYAGFYEELL